MPTVVVVLCLRCRLCGRCRVSHLPLFVSDYISKFVPWDADRSWKGIDLIRSLSTKKTSKTCQNIGNFQQLSNKTQIWICWHVLDVFLVLSDGIKLIPTHSSRLNLVSQVQILVFRPNQAEYYRIYGCRFIFKYYVINLGGVGGLSRCWFLWHRVERGCGPKLS